MRALIYARKSPDPRREEKHTSYSIDGQLHEAREYCAQHGLIVVAEITDPDEWSKTLDRPGLNRVRALAEQGAFDVFVARDVDRIARSLVLQLLFREEMEGYGLEVHYWTATYSKDDEGRLQENIRASIAEYERAKTLQRTLSGKKQKARSGTPPGIGRPAYGYAYVGDALAIVPEQASVVREIFDRYVHRLESLNEITRALNERGLPTHQQHRDEDGRLKPWYRTAVYHILQNEAYAGTGYYNKMQTLESRTNYRRLRPRDEWIAYPTPPLVDRALWQAAQVRLEECSHFSRRKPRAFYLLSGMVRCWECKKAYSGRVSKRWRAYRDGGGKHKDIGARRVEEPVWAAMRSLLLDPDSLLLGYQQLQQQAGAQGQEQEAEKAGLRRQQEKAAARMTNLVDLYLDPEGGLSRTEYLRRRAHLQAEIDELSRQLHELEERTPPAPLTTGQLQGAHDLAYEIGRRIDLLTPQEKRTTLQQLHLLVQIEWRGAVPWGHLSGVFPVNCPVELSASSAKAEQNSGIPFVLEIPLFVPVAD
jgi:site-specific DNA recombinase